MGLIENDERVRAQKPRVVGTHLGRDTVAREEEPRTHHVDGADDDGGRGRVFKPRAIVDVLAAQRRDGQRAIAKTEGVYDS